MYDLKPARKYGVPHTLEIDYEDGTTLRVPYFDTAGAMSFLRLEEGIKAVRLTEYAFYEEKT